MCFVVCSACASLIFFFFKQKTAYEMRISDWSSDVCSSDLLDGQIADLDKEIARRAREDEVARRLMTIPGIGPIAATAIAALAPAAQTFKRRSEERGVGKESVRTGRSRW